MNENMTANDYQMASPRPENKSNLLAIIGVVAVVAIVAFVMIQASSSNTTPAGENLAPTPTVAPTEVMEDDTPAPTEEAAAPVEEVVAVEMEAGSFSFSPSKITVKLGQLVRIKLTAADMEHNFSLDEFDVKSEVVAEGESTTIEFLADQVGEFEYYCNIGQHRQNGQVGTLIVEE